MAERKKDGGKPREVRGNGGKPREVREDGGKLREGQDIVVTRWIAMEAASLLAGKREDELQQYLPADMIRFVRDLDIGAVEKEAAVASAEGAVWYSLSGQGIFGALWEAASFSGVGLQIDQKKIPVRQEIIEVCEVFDLNPYLLPSGGALLIGTDHGCRLVDVLAGEGIPGAVIGYATGDNDRVVRYGQGMRFLEPVR